MHRSVSAHLVNGSGGYEDRIARELKDSIRFDSGLYLQVFQLFLGEVNPLVVDNITHSIAVGTTSRRALRRTCVTTSAVERTGGELINFG